MKYRIIEKDLPNGEKQYFLERKWWFGWQRLNVHYKFFTGAPDLSFPSPLYAREAIKHLERANSRVYDHIET